MRYFFSLAVLVVLVGCSSKEQLSGEREYLILSEKEEMITGDVDRSPVVIDQIEDKNSLFPQSHLNVSHCYSPLYFSFSMSKEWEAKLDFEASNYIKMTASPVVADGKVFCIDAGGIVYAFNKDTGEKLWRKSTTIIGKDGQIGGAMAYYDNRLIVTSSFHEGLCFNAKNGDLLWRIKLPAACKGDGITVNAGKAFIMCSNSSLHVVDISNGKILWSHSGMMSDTAFIGTSSVAIENGVVYLAYPSGEVFALMEDTGTVIWETILSKSSLVNAARAFSHPRGCPVVKNNVVYFTSASRQTVAFDARTGGVLWTSGYGSLQTPIVSGNSIFVFSTGSELVCLNKDTGKKRWSSEVFHNKEKIVDWCGMILTKGHIIMVSPVGDVVFVSANDGRIKKVIGVDDESDGISVNPVIAGGVMYILMDCGKIVAYK